MEYSMSYLTGTLYVIYRYRYHGDETYVKTLRVYNNLNHAMEYAASMCVEREEECMANSVHVQDIMFDKKEKYPGNGRIVVSSIAYYSEG